MSSYQKQFSLFDFLAILLLAIGIYFATTIIKLSNERKELVVDNAELVSVKYGLFNVYEWRDKVSVILDKKIDEFELNGTNRGEIQQKIEEMLYWLLDEVKSIFSQRANEGIVGLLQSIIAGFVIDIDDLRSRVPDIAQRAISQLGNKETMKDVKGFIKLKFREYLTKTIGNEDKTAFTKILAKYKCETKGKTTCINQIKIRIKEIEQRLKAAVLYLLLAVFGIFILYYFTQDKSFYSAYLLLLGSMVILGVGLLTPMIDIDARINEIKFVLMGEKISFEEQSMFFQSKSILDVVMVLIKNNRIDSILVGCLVLIFSVLFPLMKLYSCAIVLQYPERLSNKLTNFLVLKSGKWSMADVVVVAIIMAYIGFQGIINAQLAKIKLFSSKIEVMTTNNTQLQIGFFVFTVFCILGIINSLVVEKRVKGI
jgi:hypothetical protein